MLPNKTIIKRLTIEQALTYINWSLHFVGIMAVIYIIYAFFMTQFDILPPTSFGGLTYSSATIAFMVFGVLGAIYMVPESVRHGATRRQSTAGNFYGIVLTALLTILLILIGHGLFHVVLNLISDQYVPGPSLYEQVISTETTTNIHLFGQGVPLLVYESTVCILGSLDGNYRFPTLRILERFCYRRYCKHLVCI